MFDLILNTLVFLPLVFGEPHPTPVMNIPADPTLEWEIIWHGSQYWEGELANAHVFLENSKHPFYTLMYYTTSGRLENGRFVEYWDEPLSSGHFVEALDAPDITDVHAVYPDDGGETTRSVRCERGELNFSGDYRGADTGWWCGIELPRDTSIVYLNGDRVLGELKLENAPLYFSGTVEFN